jgi:hypothetical protein
MKIRLKPWFFYPLLPLIVLVCAAVLASVIGYGLMQIVDSLNVQKTINKITQALLVLSIFPAVVWLGLSKAELGFANRKQFLRQLAQGFGLGLATLLPIVIALFFLNVSVVDVSQAWTWAWLLEKSSIALVLSLLISCVEEPLFRGLLLAALARKLPIAAAIIVSSAYYACLHFIKSPRKQPATDLSFSDTFALLVDAFANLLNPEITTAFFALLMVGIFLALLRIHFEASLGLCIGCHTAWVWLIKMNKALFNTDFNAAYAFLVSPYDGVVGPLVMVWLLLAVLIYCVWWPLRKR